MKIFIIGGGAAGFFAAITCAAESPDNEVVIIEKSNKLLSKVRVSGGGRCNVTHACFEARLLSQNYPRGAKPLLSAFSRFQAGDTIAWFEKRGVELKIEDDGRMFPITDSSETIIKCLMDEATKLGVKIWMGCAVDKIRETDEWLVLHLSDGQIHTADKILIATGGNPKEENYNWLKELGHTIEKPVPSLFTFNIQDKDLHALAGISVPEATVKVLGEKLTSIGPLLITHWGMSGPAILKMSAWGARLLSDKNYEFSFHVNWLGQTTEEDIRERLAEIKANESKKTISTFSPFSISARHWNYLIKRAEIGETLKWADLSKKQMNKLVEELIRCEFKAQGKTTFKEEFVTCGGINLSEIDFKTMESKICKGLYFAGEVLDIDGITGGFNFQNAWTTGWIAGKAMAV